MSQVRPFPPFPRVPSGADACTPQCPTPTPTLGPAATFQGIAAAPPSSHLAPCRCPLPPILLLCVRLRSSLVDGPSSSAGVRTVPLVAAPAAPPGVSPLAPPSATWCCSLGLLLRLVGLPSLGLGCLYAGSFRTWFSSRRSWGTYEVRR